LTEITSVGDQALLIGIRDYQDQYIDSPNSQSGNPLETYVTLSDTPAIAREMSV